MSIMGEIITTSGFSEVILEVLKSPIGGDMVEKMIRVWNEAEMSINDEVITTSGFCGSHFGGPKDTDWNVRSRKVDYDLKICLLVAKL